MTDALAVLADDGCPHDGTVPPRPVVIHTDAGFQPATGRYRAAAVIRGLPRVVITEDGVVPSIDVAELMAVRLSVRLLRGLPDGTPVEIRCDNLPVVQRLTQRQLTKPGRGATALARLIRSDPDWLRLAPAVVWVCREANHEADLFTATGPNRAYRAATAMARRAAEGNAN